MRVRGGKLIIALSLTNSPLNFIVKCLQKNSARLQPDQEVFHTKVSTTRPLAHASTRKGKLLTFFENFKQFFLDFKPKFSQKSQS